MGIRFSADSLASAFFYRFHVLNNPFFHFHAARRNPFQQTLPFFGFHPFFPFHHPVTPHRHFVVYRVRFVPFNEQRTHAAFSRGFTPSQTPPRNSIPKQTQTPPRGAQENRAHNASEQARFARQAPHQSKDPTQQRLEQIFGCPLTTPESLKVAYRKWSVKNHPDKVTEEQRSKATELFQEVSVLVTQFKTSRNWS